jgi:hypothetical protein
MPNLVIERWDPVLVGNNSQPMPMIYVKANESLRKYFELNKMMVAVIISDTKSIYDGKVIGAVADCSGFYPDYRPNFYNKTGFYTLTLSSAWYHYPKFNGMVEITGFEGQNDVKPIEPKFSVPVPIAPMRENYEDEKRLSKNQILISVFALFALFFSFLIA